MSMDKELIQKTIEPVVEKLGCFIVEIIVTKDNDITLTVEKTAGDQIIRPEDRDIIIQSYKCELFGLVLDWLNSGMPQGVDERLLRLCELRRGSIEMMLERSAVR